MTGMPLPPRGQTAGLILAAGAGTRYGQPKALVHGATGRSWLQHAVDVLIASGCSPVIVVLGARATEAAALLKPSASILVVLATDWADGLSASLRAGLRCAGDLPDIEAVAVIPVDVPDVNAATVMRVIGYPVDVPAGDAAPVTVPNNDLANTLRQARFAGRPGHPVVIGRAHWEPLIASAFGDTGAGSYLRSHAARGVECGDLGTGDDVDWGPDERI